MFCFFSLCLSLSVTWKKNNLEIQNDAFHVVKAEGERHSLVIKQMRLNNVGSYCVTAVNTAGKASCSAMLSIQSGERRPEMERDPNSRKDLPFKSSIAAPNLQACNLNLNKYTGTSSHHMKIMLFLKYVNMLTHTQTHFNPPPALLRLTFCLNDYKGLLELSIPTGAPRSDSCYGNPLKLKGTELPFGADSKNANLPRHTKVS